MLNLAVAGPIACTEYRKVTALNNRMQLPLSVKAVFGTLHGLFWDCASDVEIFQVCVMQALSFLCTVCRGSKPVAPPPATSLLISGRSCCLTLMHTISVLDCVSSAALQGLSQGISREEGRRSTEPGEGPTEASGRHQSPQCLLGPEGAGPVC